MRMLPFTFRALEELQLGPTWQAVFEEKWPHYKAWFLREGEAARPSYATSVRMLRAHMPELMAADGRGVALAGGARPAAPRSGRAGATCRRGCGPSPSRRPPWPPARRARGRATGYRCSCGTTT